MYTFIPWQLLSNHRLFCLKSFIIAFRALIGLNVQCSVEISIGWASHTATWSYESATSPRCKLLYCIIILLGQGIFMDESSIQIVTWAMQLALRQQGQDGQWPLAIIF